MIPWARYVGSRKGTATFGDATCMKLCLVLEKLIGTSCRGEELWPFGTSRRGGETSRRGEVLWLVGLHVEVRYCDLDEQMISW